MVRQHNGMPVVVDPNDWPAWLGEVDPATLLGPPPDGTLRAWPLSRNVNSPRNNSAELPGARRSVIGLGRHMPP